MSSKASIRDTFFEECEDLLAALADGFTKIQSNAYDDETVNAVFRAVHSIKGGGGAFKLSDLVGFAHKFETVLDALRANQITLDDPLLFTLLRSADHLNSLVEAARDGVEIDAATTEVFASALENCIEGGQQSADVGEDFSFSAVVLDFDAPADADAPEKKSIFLISFAPQATLFANGHEPSLLFTSLADLGTVQTTLDTTALPPLGEFDTTHPYLRWELRLETKASQPDIAAVFEFVEGLCSLDIHMSAEADAPIENTVAVTTPEPTAPIQLPASVTVERDALAAVGELKSQLVQDDDIAAPKSGTPQAAGAAETHGPKPTLRVDLDRVDRLINAVGELIINQAMISQRAREMSSTTDTELVTYVEDYRLLARDIQEAVMAIRAQPVKPLFQRMSRIVREAAEATGKKAQLHPHGEEIEVDKTLIERLADPLTHMIRNAVDHGLESTETRLAIGKPASGTIKLTAAHRSGRVIISVKDDGAGLNRPKILQIAREKGLIAPDIDLADTDIDQLLFLPGFSTASKVSNLSGRGVGLDVVRTSVQALGGRVAISSTPGQGTEFTISLPLTLAVMDGMVVSVRGQTMVAPIASILETIRPDPAELHKMGPNANFLSVRGQFIPIVDIAQTLGISGSDTPNESPLLLLVESENQSQCALIVDDVFDQRQVVIKGLEHNYRSIPGVSAATVLGNGQIALILDLDAIAFQRDLPTSTLSEQLSYREGAVQ